MSVPFQFEQVRLRRMPGIDDEGFRLEDLSPGINVIHGPNASGKTTSARALELLLWPRLGDRAPHSLSARFHFDGEPWTVEVDPGRVAYQRDGASADAPPLPPAEHHDRYRLALHELLSSENEGFARAIFQETSGGYDIAAAGEVLSPRSGASACRREREALASAEAALRAAISAQERLRDEERTLAELCRRREEVDAATAQVRVLEAALEHAAARDAHEIARFAVDAYPAEMSRLRGDEYGRLCSIREKLQRNAADIEVATAERDAAFRLLDQAALADVPRPTEVIAALRADVEPLRNRERDGEGYERQCAAAAKRLEEERARIGNGVDEGKLSAIDHPAIEELAAFARRAAEIRATEAAVSAQLRIIGDAPESAQAASDAARLSDGVRLLQRWLREGDSAAGAERRTRWLGFVAAGMLSVLGLVLAVIDPLFLIATAVGSILMYLLWPRAARGGVARDVHRREYEKLHLDPPARWVPDDVERTLDLLLARQTEQMAELERIRRRETLLQEQRNQTEKVAELERDRDALIQRLGVAPAADEGHLFWLASRLNRWHDARNELSALQASLGVAMAQAGKAKSQLRDRFRALGYADAIDTSGFTGAIQDLEARRELHDRATGLAAVAERDMARLDLEREEYRAAQQAILSELELDESRESLLRDWCDQFIDYQKLVEVCRESEIALRDAKQRLNAKGADVALFGASIADIERSLASLSERASERDHLHERITAIQLRVEDAKRTYDVEAALEKRERCTAALRDARDRDTRAVVAHELLEYVQQATREEQLPAVFRRARDLFTGITRGRYELRFESGEQPRFRAYDNQERVGRSLDELSSGTRVQLLLAVRVAFVEIQEQGVRLPLFFDEVLGNSDDERAFAIIQAVVTLAREGRQIFYFTAQSDEVSKWQTVVGGEADIPLRVINLRERRGIEREIQIPELTIAYAAGARIPEPAGLSHAEYGRILRIPSLARATAHVSGLHLWYLVEQPDELHRHLVLGAETWGMLNALATRGGATLVDGAFMLSISASAVAAQAFLDASRIGFGRPVDRAVLLASGAVSTSFIDRVDDLARTLGGDARQLLPRVRDLRSFRQTAADRLQEYLEEQGHLDLRNPLSIEERRLNALAAAASQMDKGLVSVDQLDRLFTRLRVGLSEAGTIMDAQEVTPLN